MFCFFGKYSFSKASSGVRPVLLCFFFLGCVGRPFSATDFVFTIWVLFSESLRNEVKQRLYSYVGWAAERENNTTPVNSLRGSQKLRLQQFFCSITLPFFATDTYTKVAQGPTLVYTVYCISLSQKIEFFLCLIYFRIWVWILAGPEIRAQRAPMPPSKSLNRIISWRFHIYFPFFLTSPNKSCLALSQYQHN